MTINDCKYSEELVQSLQAASEQLLSVPLGVGNIDAELLNKNTAAINSEIKKYRNTRNNLAISKLQGSETLDRPGTTTAFGPIISIPQHITQTIDNQRRTELRTFDSDFPYIDRRVRLSDLTSAEVSEIITSNGLNPRTVEVQVRLSPISIFRLTEKYLENLGNNGIDIVGSCFTVNNVYSKTVGQTDPFNNAGSFVDKFSAFINSIGAKLSNLLNLIQDIIALIQTAQELLLNIQQSIQTVIASLGGIFASDFGLAEAIQLISIVNNIISFIESVKDINKDGTCPISKISINSILSQLTQLSNLTAQLNTKMYSDYVNVSTTFDNLTISLYAEAESVSVSNPARTQEISTLVKQTMNGDLSDTFSTLGKTSKQMGLLLEIDLDNTRELMRAFAAVGVLNNLEQQLSSVVDNSSSQLKSKLYFFTSELLNNNFNFNMGPIYSKNAGLVASTEKAASDETADQMKIVIQGQIVIASERYRDPKKEEVDFVVLRFGGLAREVERLFDQSAKPLERVHTQFRETDRILSAAGNNNTLKAINGGATRFDTQARSDASRQSGLIPATTANGGIANVPQGTVPYDGYGPTPKLPSGYQFPSYDDAIAGRNGVRYNPGPASSLSGKAGFTPKSVGGGVDVDALYMLYLLATRWGQTIIINSAYRNIQAQEAIYGRGTGRRGQHFAGKAFDCSISGRSNQIQFMNLAYQVGFRGFGSYGTFTHIDTGSTRAWGNFNYYNLSGPAGTKGN